MVLPPRHSLITGMNFNHGRFTYLLLFGLPLLCGLICRLGYIAALHETVHWSYLSVDNWYFHNWAEQIAAGNLIGETAYFRGPLYAWALGAGYALFGSSLWVPRMLGLMLGELAVVLIVLLASRHFGFRAGLISGLIYALLPAAWYYESDLTAEPLMIALLLGSALALQSSMFDSRKRFLLVSGLLFGLAALARPTALIVLPLLMIVLLTRQQWKITRLLGKQIGLLSAGLAIVIMPISVRNLLIAGEPVLIAHAAGVNLYLGNNRHADGTSAAMPPPLGTTWNLDEIRWLAEIETGKPLSYSETDRYWSDQAIRYWGEEPIAALKLYAVKCWWALSDVAIANNRSGEPYLLSDWFVQLNWIRHGFLVWLLLVGLIVFGRRAPTGFWWLAGAIVLWFGSTALFFVCSRFLHPVAPLLSIAAGVVLSQLRSVWRSRSGILIFAAICAAAVVWWPRSAPGNADDKPSLPVLLAMSEIRSGNYQHALHMLERIEQTSPNASNLQLHLGIAQLRLGNLDASAVSFLREFASGSQPDKAALNLASISLLSSDSLGAQRLLDSVSAFRRRDPLTARLQVRTLAALPTNIGLIDSLSFQFASDDLVQLEVAGWYERLGRPGEAAAAIDRTLATRLPALETDSRMFLADFFQARASDRQVRSALYLQRSMIAGLANDLPLVISCCAAALDYDSSSAGAWQNLIRAHRLMGNDRAVDSLKRRANSILHQDLP